MITSQHRAAIVHPKNDLELATVDTADEYYYYYYYYYYDIKQYINQKKDKHEKKFKQKITWHYFGEFWNKAKLDTHTLTHTHTRVWLVNYSLARSRRQLHQYFIPLQIDTWPVCWYLVIAASLMQSKTKAKEIVQKPKPNPWKLHLPTFHTSTETHIFSKREKTKPFHFFVLMDQALTPPNALYRQFQETCACICI